MPTARSLLAGRPGAVLAVGVTAALVLLTADVAGVTGRQQPSVQSALDERLPALIAFVEAERGLELRRPVAVQVLDDEAFFAAYYAEPEELPDEEGEDVGGEPQDRAATLGALGLVDPDELDAAAEELDEGIGGFYDPATEELVVRADRDSPYLDLVVVHELVHALQDQHFLLKRVIVDPERALAFSSLVEGDAARVEEAWRSAQPAAVRAELTAEEERLVGASGGYAGLEDPVGGTEAFPYVAGLLMVEALLEEGGQARLDRAFLKPPLTTEQVLHPEQVGRSDALSPPAPQGEGEVVDAGTLGELGLAQLLFEDPREGGPQVGWEGGSYATRYDEDADRTCTAAEVVMVDAAARDALLDELHHLEYEAQPHGAASLRLQSCSSGA